MPAVKFISTALPLVAWSASHRIAYGPCQNIPTWDNVMLYIRDLGNKSSKVTWYKIHLQKSVAFYIPKEANGKSIRENPLIHNNLKKTY